MPSSPGSRSSSPACTAVIFDFEGTLVDFQWRLGPAQDELRRAFAGLGFRGDECAEAEFANDPPDHMISHLGELIELVAAD